MSNYIKLTENEILPVAGDVTDIELEVLKKNVLLQMEQEREMLKKSKCAKKRNRKNSWGIKKVAVAALVLGIATPTAVYAAGKLGLFEGLFGDKDTTPIEQYVEMVETEQAVIDGEGSVRRPENPIYQMENDDYSIVVDSFVYSEATDYGIVQFTVTDKDAEGDDWYDVATWDEWYRDWTVWDATEIFAGLGNKKLWFEVTGLAHQNNRCFVKEIDEQTSVCYLCFNDMKSTSMAESILQLSVKESKMVMAGENEELTWSQIMKLDVPVGESLPSYTWYDEAGEVALILTSVDFWLIDAPESSVSGRDIILKEVSVQMKDGSSYHIQSEEKKIIDWFYATAKEEGDWRNFANVIDLEEVISFTVDGKVFFVKDAVKTGL